MRQGLKIIFMGVSGSGKTTLAALTAERLGCGPVLEADTFHSADTKAKMASGVALTDEDRWPWLKRIHNALVASGDRTTIATCSALKNIYRQKLYAGELVGKVHFIFLDAPQEIIAARLATRQHEYMPASLLGSQFNTLEKPESGEPCTRISVEGTQDETLALVLESLGPL